ncbi:hypothetical protein HN011_012513 [Eciton burchellii]|jgi:hypothetical protein|nr:hypothetical protein HN011_012513 [Eciton burchellii]
MDPSELIEGSLPERIIKRDRERKNVIEKRREERQSLTVESEQSGYFKEMFYTSCKKIKDMLDNAPSTSSSALPGIFEKSTKEIQLLKNYLLQSKMFLKVYDIRRAQENLQLLENQASELETKLLPKKKFGFKNRRIIKKQTDKGVDITDGLKDLNISESIVNGSTKQNNKSSSKYGESACMLLGKVDEQLILDAENVNKNDILLSDLIRCTIRIYGTPSTLHMVNLKNCTILVGPVTSSVFAHNCDECVFAFACQQLRLHSSTDCTIYLHVTSRAIIEDCTKIYVAPYNWSYEDQTNHFNLAGLDQKVNNWNCIDDFNWLSSEKQSPNWSILEPEFRVKTWD